MQNRVLRVLKEGGENGMHLKDLYPKFPDNLKQSIRGTVLRLVKTGTAQRVDEGVYRATQR